MTVFQNKNLVKAFLEKKNQGRKKVGKFRFRQKKLRHRNRYQNPILVSVADTETRFRSYTKPKKHIRSQIAGEKARKKRREAV
jgi:hypothetical protein